jgi:hypothetical protein
LASPRSAWTYWVDATLAKIFHTLPKLARLCPPRQGLATTDNARFVRYWWEVTSIRADAPLQPTKDKWFPYAKSGQFRRWYEAPKHRVNWANDGEEIKASILERYPYLDGKWQWVAKNTEWYFKPGVTYSYLTSGRFSARRLDPGAIFDVAGSSLFPEDPRTLLALLNSSVAHGLLQAINPTVNFQVGDLAELPVPTLQDETCASLVNQAIAIQEEIDQFDPASPDYAQPLAWTEAAELQHKALDRLQTIESRIDERVSELYGVAHAPETHPAVELQLPASRAAHWINHSLQHWLCRCQTAFAPVDSVLAKAVFEHLVELTGSDSACAIADAVGGVESFLARDLAGWQSRVYHRRPVLWILGTGGTKFVVAHDCADRSVLRHIARKLKTTPPGETGTLDDGIISRLKRLKGMLSDRMLARWIAQRPT